MLFDINRSLKLKGEIKNQYLANLDSSLARVAEALRSEKALELVPEIREYGAANNWDWSVLNLYDTSNTDIFSSSNTDLAKLVDRAREEYAWFDWVDNNKDPSLNKGFFTELTISEETGLPAESNFIALKNIQEDWKKKIESIPSYDTMASNLLLAARSDSIKPSKLKEYFMNIQTNGMKRNFLEQIKNANLIDWNVTGTNYFVVAEEKRTLGLSDNWSISALNYDAISGMFHAYILDIEQDLRDDRIPLIYKESGKEPVIALELLNKLKRPVVVPAYRILADLDEQFSTLHPVKVIRLVLGTYENKYLSPSSAYFKPLNVTKNILKQDPSAGIFRAMLQYSFAPNNDSIYKDTIRQDVPLEEWSDVFCVVPSQYSSRVASLKGDRLIVLDL